MNFFRNEFGNHMCFSENLMIGLFEELIVKSSEILLFPNPLDFSEKKSIRNELIKTLWIFRKKEVIRDINLVVTLKLGPNLIVCLFHDGRKNYWDNIGSLWQRRQVLIWIIRYFAFLKLFVDQKYNDMKAYLNEICFLKIKFE